MNQGTVTGGVVEAARSAYTPATKETAATRKVLFSIVVSDSRRGEHLWKCEAEGDPAFLDFIEGQATRGRGIKLEYELAARPFFKGEGKNRVHCGEVRFLRVIRAEFSAPRVSEPVEAGA
jgi:hypothetical protein